MKSMFSIEAKNWNEKFSSEVQSNAISSLEDGNVLFFPNLKFDIKPEEKPLFNKELDLKVKSIKYNLKEERLWGVKNFPLEKEAKQMINRYSLSALSLVKNLLPFYEESMLIYNSSFRPVEADGRKQSKRHDDTRLHVDSFPSRPSSNKRLLRVFANVNQEGVSRVWNVGESFESVAKKFLPQIKPPLPFSAKIMKALKLTKALRTPYDHYMLALHDSMKLDETYQQNVEKQTVLFPAGSVWVCFSDQTSHAVLSGNCLLEQTVLIPVEGMKNPNKSPLHILEKMLNKKLI